MRSTFAGLNTMVRGVLSNQLSLNTVGHNITNANTEGYSRQSVNLAAIRAQEESSLYGSVMVGRGVDTMSLTRARDIYADKQYWSGTSTYEYYQARQKQYDKVEAIFNDTTNETIESSLAAFYKSWQTLSTTASDSSSRIAVLEQGKVFADKIHTAAQELQEQIEDNYADIELNVSKVNLMLEQVVDLNKGISSAEATGAMANDLRDQRDLLVDYISKYLNVNVYESDNGMYSLVSNGVSLVNGIDHLTLQMSDAIPNGTYGVNDYNIEIKEVGITYQPTDGILKAEQDAIAEQKEYIDHLANMAAFMLSTFNSQHQQGVGIDSSATGAKNFFGDDDTLYTWDAASGSLTAEYSSAGLTSSLSFRVDSSGARVVDDMGKYIVEVSVGVDSTGDLETTSLKGINIIHELEVNTLLTDEDGEKLVAARGYGYTLAAGATAGTGSTPATGETIEVNGTGDGSNAVWIETLFNMGQENTFFASGDRSIGTISLNAYYLKAMTTLGTDSEAMDSYVEAQKEIMTQITEWRSSTSGVNWNEELTNMIMFQQGYNACSRCLTTMDEMLDRLINNTGTVGR